MRNTEKVNFESLRFNFRSKENVLRAVSSFKNLQHNSNRLSHILRHHRDQPIETESEVQFRDDMDFLIGYYAVLALALVCGYISVNALDLLDSDDRDLLNHPAVRIFYEIHYPVVLPTVLRLAINNATFRDRLHYFSQDSPIDSITFESFLSFYRGRLEDDDIDSMLFFLDDGWIYDKKLDTDVGISQFLFVLKNPDVYRTSPDVLNNSEVLDQVILGFSKYMNYISEYGDLLKELKQAPYQQAAIWLLESYWFTRFNDYLGEVFQNGIRNLFDAVNRDQFIQFDEDLDEELLVQWREESFKMLDRSQSAISWLRELSLGEPITQVVQDYLSRENS